MAFDYREAFSRNLGFLTAREQETLRGSRVAVAGVGGDGGLLAVQLARLGVGAFALADPETFDLENLNRQAGSSVSTIGHKKATTIAGMIRAINPLAEISEFEDGVEEGNLGSFLEGADLLIDETEITTPRIALMLARGSRDRGIANMTVLNIGFSCLATSFVPGGTTLEAVLGIGSGDVDEVSLSNWLAYLPPYVDIELLEQVNAGVIPIPSVAPGVAVAASVGSTQALLHLVHRAETHSFRPPPVTAPRALVIDVMTGKAKRLRMSKWNHRRHVLGMLAASKRRKTAKLD